MKKYKKHLTVEQRYKIEVYNKAGYYKRPFQIFNNFVYEKVVFAC